MIETEIHNSFDKLDKLTEIAWEIQKGEGFVLLEGGREFTKSFLKDRRSGNKLYLLQTKRIVYTELEKVKWTVTWSVTRAFEQ